MSNLKVNANSFVVSKRLIQFREEKGYTIQRMAVTAGIDPKHLKKIESGLSEPSILILWKLMNSLGKDLTDLFNKEFDDLYLLFICEEDVDYEN